MAALYLYVCVHYILLILCVYVCITVCVSESEYQCVCMYESMRVHVWMCDLCIIERTCMWNACGVHAYVGVMLCELYAPITCL